jgi:DNA-binding transcriptional regulator YiaG
MFAIGMNPDDLKKRRERLDLTQAALAEVLGVTGNTVARWETGQRGIPKMAVRLLDCLAREPKGKSRSRARTRG